MHACVTVLLKLLASLPIAQLKMFHFPTLYNISLDQDLFASSSVFGFFCYAVMNRDPKYHKAMLYNSKQPSDSQLNNQYMQGKIYN